jgi:tetratricopeptide (TPR) repeat protein
MADVIVIYKREDRSLAGAVAKALEAHCCSVWWDTRAEGGDVWDSTVETELKAADCVVAVWSRHSIASEGFLRIARYHRALVRSVAIDDVAPPRDFLLPERLASRPEYAAAAQEFVAVDVSRWTEDAFDAAFSQVIAKVRRCRMWRKRDRAEEHCRRQDYDLAIAECNRAIEIDPSYRQAYLTRITAHMEKKDYNRVIAECSELIDGRRESSPSNIAEYYSRRALAHLYKSEHECAIADSTKALEHLALDDDTLHVIDAKIASGHVCFIRGTAYHREGLYDRAIRDLTRATETPWVAGRPRFYLGRARAYEKRGLPGDSERAKADYRKVVERKRGPGHAEATEALARLGDAP